ncbi:Uncharacterized protein OBRU01_14880 [Operophtera brumata]|uniref:Ig-like domain-containing protein n=1 Tax=Operophtera brumata TaxID=104452 RepID=A0A0L7L5G4_OPEBR|nr:Uncharacterized protein OBRU01_14880 [Operophtera brumata]
MVALNPRLSVTYNNHNTWKLHVSNVQANDSGTYMCQMGHLSVVIPPDIVDSVSEGSSSQEGGSIRLTCSATGVPPPTVLWRRELNRPINPGSRRYNLNYGNESELSLAKDIPWAFNEEIDDVM